MLRDFHYEQWRRGRLSRSGRPKQTARVGGSIETFLPDQARDMAAAKYAARAESNQQSIGCWGAGSSTSVRTMRSSAAASRARGMSRACRSRL